jgi:hypothetical protein
MKFKLRVEHKFSAQCDRQLEGVSKELWTTLQRSHIEVVKFRYFMGSSSTEATKELGGSIDLWSNWHMAQTSIHGSLGLSSSSALHFMLL